MTTITIALPVTGFVRPSDSELASLLKIVASGHPGEASQVDLAEFSRAFISVGFMFRTASPRQDRYLIHFADRANEFLRERFGDLGVTASALFLAVRAHNDIPWRPRDLERGQLLEIGLDEHHGIRLPQPNAWVGLLKSDNLLTPTPPDPLRPREPGRGPVRYYRLNPGGALRLMADDESIW